MSEILPPTRWRPWRWPPFWFTLAILAMFWLEWKEWGPALPVTVPAWIGYAVFATGAVLVVNAVYAFQQHATPVCPFRRPTFLLQEGLYRYSRNPLYLGEVIMLAGLALLFRGSGPWLVLPVFVVMVEWLFIRPEEKILADTFGEKFVHYRGKTRRWL